MIPLHFSLPLVQFFADHRNPVLTYLLLGASFFGSAAFYILFTILIFAVFDKRLAVRLSVLILLTMSCNDILKLFLKNPRPFVRQGTFLKEWAVPHRDAVALAAEYSTPSGHAMGSSAFYAYFFAFLRRRFVRVLLVLLIFLIGLSRPYLGVHYVEDVLLGWAIGLALAFGAIRYTDPLARLWGKCPHGWQITLTVLASLVFWLIAFRLNGGRIDSQVREMTAYCGFLTGMVIACPLELRHVNFDPRSCSARAKILRYALSIAVMAIFLFALKSAFRPLAAETTVLGCALEYVRYIAAEFAAMFLAPLAFCRMHLAARMPVGAVRAS